jgi:hypothetical protein
MTSDHLIGVEPEEWIHKPTLVLAARFTGFDGSDANGWSLLRWVAENGGTAYQHAEDIAVLGASGGEFLLHVGDVLVLNTATDQHFHVAPRHLFLQLYGRAS